MLRLGFFVFQLNLPCWRKIIPIINLCHCIRIVLCAEYTARFNSIKKNVLIQLYLVDRNICILYISIFFKILSHDRASVECMFHTSKASKMSFEKRKKKWISERQTYLCSRRIGISQGKTKRQSEIYEFEIFAPSTALPGRIIVVNLISCHNEGSLPVGPL